MAAVERGEAADQGADKPHRFEADEGDQKSDYSVKNQHQNDGHHFSADAQFVSQKISGPLEKVCDHEAHHKGHGHREHVF